MSARSTPSTTPSHIPPNQPHRALPPRRPPKQPHIARTLRRAPFPQVRGGIIDQRDHDHDGRCSARLRILAGVLVREIVCDDCGAVIQTLGSSGTYQLTPTRIERAA
jgi:hypothetical protein